MTTSWPLVAYTLCAVVACGALGVSSVRALRGRGAAAQLPGTALALAASVLAVVFACLRLGRASRVMNVFAHPASAVSQTFIALFALVVASVVYVTALRRSEEEGRVPVWTAVLGVLASLFGAYAVGAGDVATALSAPKTALSVAMVALSSACAGTLLVRGIEGLRISDTPAMGWASVICSVLSGAGVAAFSILAPGLGKRATTLTTSTFGFDASHPTQAVGEALAATASAWSDQLTWCAVVGLGILVPLVCALLSRRRGGVAGMLLGAAGVACLLVGLACAMHLFMFTTNPTRLLI